jgi:hypothetical protein
MKFAAGTTLMSLQEQLDAFESRTAPSGRPALCEAKIEELRARFALEKGGRYWRRCARLFVD